MPKTRLPLVASILLLVALSGQPTGAHERPPPRPGDPLALIGDSLTNHGDWPEVLHRKDATNWGKSGYTTGQLIWTFKDLLAQQPGLKVVFLQGGINDLTLGVPPERVYRNQVEAIEYWRSHGVTPVLEAIVLRADDPEINRLIASLNARLESYCRDREVEFLDPNTVLSVDGHLRQELTTDGTHLKPQAYGLWAKLILAELDRLHL